MEYLGGLRILLVNVVALKLESRLTRQQPSFVSLVATLPFLYEDTFDHMVQIRRRDFISR